MARIAKPNKTGLSAEVSSKPGAKKRGSGLVRLVFRPGVLFWAAMAVCAVAFVPRLVRLLPELGERDEYRVAANAIEINAPPHGVPPDLVEQVARRAGLPETLSLLDDDVTERVAEAFRRHPWVAEVVRVRKSFPARIEVELKYRRPAAMVEIEDGLYPVDAAGILLPPADFSLRNGGFQPPSGGGRKPPLLFDTRRYPLIQNPQSTPRGPAGTAWGDVGVLGAARLADVLAAHWKEFDLAAIRIPDRAKATIAPDDVIYELVTRGGSRIVWGRAPRSDHPGELSAAQKIGRLEKYLADFGRFDQPHGPYEIDIRHWQEISRRPLSTGRERGGARR